MNDKSKDEPEDDLHYSWWRYPTIREALFESFHLKPKFENEEGRLPFFKTSRELAIEITSRFSASYRSRPSLEALLSQILNGHRPMPRKLVDAILTVLRERKENSVSVAEALALEKILTGEHEGDPDAEYVFDDVDFQKGVVIASTEILSEFELPDSVFGRLLGRAGAVATFHEVDFPHLEVLVSSQRVAEAVFSSMMREIKSERHSSFQTRFTTERGNSARIDQNIEVYIVSPPFDCVFAITSFAIWSSPDTDIPDVYALVRGSIEKLSASEAQTWKNSINFSMEEIKKNSKRLTWSEYCDERLKKWK